MCLEKRKFLPLSGLELRLLGRPARSQSLYRQCYPDSDFLLFSAFNSRHYSKYFPLDVKKGKAIPVTSLECFGC
jgi:hypothetical protein